MPTKRGLRKLVDVWGSQAGRFHDVLQRYLEAHGISYEMSSGEDPYGRPYWRYKVQARDLCCAQTGLLALRDMQRGALREES